MTLASKRVRHFALLATLCAAFIGTNAWAQPVEVATRTAARELATSGAEALERGDYATALDHLSRANSLHPAPSISVLVARSLAHLGRLVEALDQFEETMRAPLSEDAPEAYRVAAHEASVEAEQLRVRIPRVTIQIRSGGQVPGSIAVLFDQKELPRALLDVEFPIDPGEHTVIVRSPNFERVTRQVQLAEQERVVLEITLNDPTPAPKVTNVPPKEWDESKVHSSRMT
ncbi:MAG TPA: hypothetical protein VIV60_25075, partial [Polyangiaceae bacterium]